MPLDTSSSSFIPRTAPLACPFRMLTVEGSGSMQLISDENTPLCTLTSTSTRLGDCEGRPFRRLSHQSLSNEERLWNAEVNDDCNGVWLSLVKRIDPFGDAAPQVQRFVFKIATEDKKISQLLHEADIYHGKNQLAGSVIPQYYGFFTGNLGGIEIVLLVLEYCDGPASAARDSETFKEQKMRMATDLHIAGINHGGLTKDYNFVSGRDGFPRIVNFSHARYHQCAGTQSKYLGSLRTIRNAWKNPLTGCRELVELDEHLGRPRARDNDSDDELSTTISEDENDEM